MPINYIKKLRDKYDLSTAKLEKKWEEATLAIGDEYNDKPEFKYAAITKIFKKKINKSFGLNESETLDVDDYIDIKRKILLESVYKTRTELEKMTELQISKYANELRLKRTKLKDKDKEDIQKQIDLADSFRTLFKK